MSTATKTKAKKTTKKTAKVTKRPVDPFAQPTAVATKPAVSGVNTNTAPSNDPELGNVAGDIASFAAAKVKFKAAEAEFKAVSGVIMGYGKRILLGILSKTGSKPASQKLIGDDDAVVTTYYQNRSLNVDGGRYDTLCNMFGKDVTDNRLVEFTGYAIADGKMDDAALVTKMKKALQSALTVDELTGLFVAKHVSRKDVIDQACELCSGDVDKMDQLLQLTVPKPTLK